MILPITPLPSLEFSHKLGCSGRQVLCIVDRAEGQAPAIRMENCASLFAVEKREIERWLKDVCKIIKEVVTEDETLAFEWFVACKMNGVDPNTPRPEAES